MCAFGGCVLYVCTCCVDVCTCCTAWAAFEQACWFQQQGLTCPAITTNGCVKLPHTVHQYLCAHTSHLLYKLQGGSVVLWGFCVVCWLNECVLRMTVCASGGLHVESGQSEFHWHVCVFLPFNSSRHCLWQAGLGCCSLLASAHTPALPLHPGPCAASTTATHVGLVSPSVGSPDGCIG